MCGGQSVEGRKDRQVGGRTGGQSDAWIGGGEDERMGGVDNGWWWMDGWMDTLVSGGWMDEG